MSHPWFAFYPRDYRDKTSGLSMVEDGAYRRLMDEYFITGKPLSAIAGFLPRVCRAVADDEKAAIEHVLTTYFWLDAEGDGCWHHDRIDEELGKRAELSQKRSVAGGKGADKTNGKRPAKTSATERQLPTHPHPQSQEDTSLRSVSRTPPVASHASRQKEPDGFLEFYEKFPLHKARPAAAKAYASALSRASPEILLAGAVRYAASRRDEDAKFTKHPATWLNQDCWLDQELPTHQGRQNGKQPLSTSFGSTVSRVVEERAARRAAEEGIGGFAGAADDLLEGSLDGGNPQLRLAHQR